MEAGRASAAEDADGPYSSGTESEEVVTEVMLALYDFDGDPAQNQITLRKGDHIGVIDKDEGGWWWG